MVKLNQYKDELYLSGFGNSMVLQINYRGTFVGVLVPDSKVIMTRNKIIIFDIKDFNENEPLIYYEGNLNIGSCQYIDSSRKVQNAYSIHSTDVVNKIYYVWEECNDKYEDFNYLGKYGENMKTTLTYKSDGVNYWYHRYKKTRTIRGKSRERNILEKINEKRGLDGFK